MEFAISTALTQAVVNKSVKALSTKDITPSLRCFLIKGEGTTLSIISGDGAVYIDKTLEGIDIKVPGSILVDGKEFTRLVNKITADNIALALVDNKLVIKAGKSTFKLKTQDAKDYIFPEDIKLELEGIQVLLPEFKNALKLSSITVSKNATELQYTGYLIGPEIMTTNRNNITIYKMPLVGDRCLLNPDFVKLVHDLDGDHALLGYTEDFVEFKTPGTRILGNLLAGEDQFPQSEDVAGIGEYNKKAIIAKKDLIPILDRAQIFVEKTGAINLKFRADGVLECRLVGVLDSDTYEELNYQGSIDMEVNASLGMLFDICSSIDSDTFELQLTNESENPILVSTGNYSAYIATMLVQ